MWINIGEYKWDNRVMQEERNEGIIGFDIYEWEDSLIDTEEWVFIWIKEWIITKDNSMRDNNIDKIVESIWN
jgi:hypothetical protein